MIKLKNNIDLNNIRLKMLLVYLLNIIDIFFTLIFSNTGMFIELNPFMQNIITNQGLAILIKCVVPAILFTVIYFRMKKATPRQLAISAVIINAILIFYLAINLLHIISLGIYKCYGVL